MAPRPSALIGSLLMAAALVAVGCADEVGQSESNVTDCTGAWQDDGGYCRLPNGRFAADECCATGALSDEAIYEELSSAVVGLETNGSEGDPDPYQVYVFDLAPDQSLTCEHLTAQLLPQIAEFDPDDPTDEYIPGCDVGDLAEFFAANTAPNPDDYDPEDFPAAQAAAVKWAAVKALMDENLGEQGYYDVGFRYGQDGSLETGPVAFTVIGRSATGRVFAIAGVVIWT
jgi:hypothetical protein